MQTNSWKYISIATIASVILFFLFALLTAMIPNPFFVRMTPPTLYEWIILIITTILVGMYIGLYYYKKEQQNTKSACAATSGGFLGFLTFGCAVCNKILVFILGISGVMTYFLPIQPYLGIVSIGLLSYGIYSVWGEK